VLALTAGCSGLVQSDARKPAATHYSPAFVKDRKLFVFPFEGNEVAIGLASELRSMTFSASGLSMYGVAESYSSGKPALVALAIKPGGVSPLLSSMPFVSVYGLAVDASEGMGIISATLERDGVRECGLFRFDIKNGGIEHIVDNLSGRCDDFLSSWSHLSISPDGSRIVGTVGKGQLGIIDLRSRRVEKRWSGTAAAWSPDGKWIAALTFEAHMQVDLVRSGDLSVQRRLGPDDSGSLEWSPDSRYLLLWDAGLCGIGTGYVGTLQVLDIKTGQRMSVNSSKCKVDLMTIGWVSDDVLK